MFASRYRCRGWLYKLLNHGMHFVFHRTVCSIFISTLHALMLVHCESFTPTVMTKFELKKKNRNLGSTLFLFLSSPRIPYNCVWIGLYCGKEVDEWYAGE